MKTGDKIVVEMRHERETKGTHLYMAVDEINGKVPDVYIKKGSGGIEGEAPQRLLVTIEAVRMPGDES